MDLNLFDLIILGITGVGLLFGILWGALRIIFFAFSVGVAFALWPLSVPLTDSVLQGLIFDNLGNSTYVDTIRPMVTISIALFIPFLIVSIVLVAPYGVLAKYLNPFINYGIGAMMGLSVGFVLTVIVAVLYASFSEGQPERPRLCGSRLAPFVYSGTAPVLDIGARWNSGDDEWRAWLDTTRRAVLLANPNDPRVCPARGTAAPAPGTARDVEGAA